MNRACFKSATSFICTLIASLFAWNAFAADGNPDADAYPLVPITPDFPQRCVSGMNDVEIVAVRFDVNQEGRVENHSIVSTTNSCFNRSSIMVLDRWRYIPKIVYDKPVWRRDVFKVFVYLENGRETYVRNDYPEASQPSEAPRERSDDLYYQPPSSYHECIADAVEEYQVIICKLDFPDEVIDEPVRRRSQPTDPYSGSPSYDLSGTAIPANECTTVQPAQPSSFQLVITNVCSFNIFVAVEMLTNKGTITRMDWGMIRSGEVVANWPGGFPAEGDYRNGPPWKVHTYRNSNSADDGKTGAANPAQAAARAQAGLN